MVNPPSLPDQDQILLQTKLHRPPITGSLLVRPRLLDQLNSSIDRPITLVCAPAGFGKTTLVCTWLEDLASSQGEKETSLPATWLSLDENDSDLNFFMRYCIAALRMVFKDACAETLVLLQARQEVPQAVLQATFSNELEALPGEVILVLDDYQFISGEAVHNLLSELMRHWPKPLHLVLISRINPPMPLAGLRAKGMLNEIRARDLRFTSQETETYLSQSQLVHIDQSALQLLDARFEGWPAGLHLAAISLRSTAGKESVLSAISGENSNITGYLLDEVLTHQLPAIHTFLLKTSILDRFCAPLCEAIIGESDTAWNVRACLDWIERSELFIIPLDDRREWYRYHHLFQELLQQRLSAEMTPDQVNNLHHLASAWFEEHGLLDEAMQHAMAAGDFDLAARQIYAGLRDVLNREDRPTTDAGIVFICYDSEVTAPTAYNLTFDNYDAAVKSTEWLAKTLNYKGNIVVINGVPGTTVDSDRRKGCGDVIAKYPGMKIVSEFPGMWANGPSQEGMAKILAAGIAFDGIFTQGGGAGTVQALLDAKHKLVPIANESENMVRLMMMDPSLKEKGFSAISYGSPLYQGAACLYYGLKILQGDKSVPKRIVVPYPIVLAPGDTYVISGDKSKLAAAPLKLTKTGSAEDLAAGANVFSAELVGPGFFANIYHPEFTPGLDLTMALTGRATRK